jgi:hypothetical protein
VEREMAGGRCGRDGKGGEGRRREEKEEKGGEGRRRKEKEGDTN